MNEQLYTAYSKAFNELKQNLNFYYPRKAFAPADETIDRFYEIIQELAPDILSDEYLAFQIISKQHMLDSIAEHNYELFTSTINKIEGMTLNELNLN